jgi:hypothetical protein
MVTATLTMEWDQLHDPTDEDLLRLFGLEAETSGQNMPTLLWTSADLAWEWLSRWGYKPGKVEQTSLRKPRRGFVREITVNWVKFS